MNNSPVTQPSLLDEDLNSPVWMRFKYLRWSSSSESQALVFILALFSLLIYTLCKIKVVRHSLFPVLFALKGLSKFMEIIEIMLNIERLFNVDLNNSNPPIFIFHKYVFFGPKVFIIGDGEFAHYILKNTNNIKYCRNKWLSSIQLHESVIGAGSGLKWQTQRGIFSHNMLSYNKDLFKNKCGNIIDEYINEWKYKSQLQGFNLLSELISMIIEIHCQTLLNCTINDIVCGGKYFKNKDNFIKEMMDHIQVISEFYHNKEYQTKTKFSHKHFLPSIENILNKQINNKTEDDGFISKLCTNLLLDDQLLDDHQDKDKKKLHRAEIIGFYSLILFALTPAFALFWIMMMYKHCDKDKKLKCKNNPLYLKAFITESMRLYAPINTLLSRTSLRNDKFDNIDIPKNSTIIISPAFIQSLEYNHKNAHQFIPERWIKNDELKTKLPNGAGSNFIPFGAGSNHCLGRRIAMDEISIFCNKFINQYDLNLDIVNSDFNLFDNKKSHWKRFSVFSYSWPSKQCLVKIM